jgi:hypothetical protein
LTTIRLEIRPGQIVVRLPARNFTMTIRDEIALRDGKIVAVGEHGAAAIAAVSAEHIPDHVVKAAFDASDFDPHLASAITRYAIAGVMTRSGIGWRHRITLPDLEISWPAWASISLEKRRTYLTAYRDFRVDVNGQPTIRPRVDLPVLRSLLGRRIVLED